MTKEEIELEEMAFQHNMGMLRGSNYIPTDLLARPYFYEVMPDFSPQTDINLKAINDFIVRKASNLMKV